MIVPLRRFRSLGPEERRLVLEAALLLLVVRTGLHVCRFPALRGLLDRVARPGAGRGGRAPEVAGRIRHAIDAASRHLPGRTTCLVDALAADVMLRRRGLESTLRIGVMPTSRTEGRLDAHAWVQSAGTIVAGNVGTLPAYTGLSPAAPTAEDTLAAVVRGEAADWRNLGATPADVVDACVRHDMAGVVHERLRRGPRAGSWTPQILDGLAVVLRTRTAEEALRRRELAVVLDALAPRGVRPVLFKGVALAYGVYSSPAARPRNDVDLLIRREDVHVVKETLARLGYAEPTYCDGELLFCQFELSKRDRFGVDHACDFHWNVSTQAAFAGVVSYADLARESIELPGLAPGARAAGPVHALLLACIHPAMHHRNQERLIWLYDVHLLASMLGEADLRRFTGLALDARVAAVCAYQLGRAQARFGTNVPDEVLQALSAPPSPERSAGYLTRERRWHHELLASMRSLGRWRDRLQLAREVLVPSRQYMLAAYGVPSGARGAAVLPALYAHRALYGAWKVLRGRK